MKQIIIILIVLIFCMQAVMAQDKVYKKDGTVVDVKVVEQSWMVLKYRMNDYPDGPILWMPLQTIKKIEYGNGVVDQLSGLNPRIKKPFTASLDIALLEEGSVVPMLEAGYFIFPQVELTAQFFTDISETLYLAAGPKIHLSSNYSSKWVTPFMGVLVGTDSGTPITKIPIGINFASKMGINLMFSYNMIQYWYTDVLQLSTLELGVGWRF